MELLAIVLFATTAFAQAPGVTDTVQIAPPPSGMNILQALQWVWQNIELIVAAISGVILALDLLLRVTPTEKDNNALRLIQSWLDRLVPNRRKGGGSFAAYSKPDDAPTLGYVAGKKVGP